MRTDVYEKWVLALRAWGDDPSTPLDGLPDLSVETFTPATYERLLKHLRRAIDKMMVKWQAEFERDMDNARDEHDVSRALVRARGLLMRRVELANHPGFPEPIREALRDSAKTAIEDLQADLEKGVKSSQSATSIESNRMAQVVAASPLTAVLSEGFGKPVVSDSEPDTEHGQGDASEASQPKTRGGILAKFGGFGRGRKDR